MNASQIYVLQQALMALEARGGMDVLAAVSGVKEKRIVDIMKGAEPNMHEFVTLDNLRSMV